MTKPQYLTLSKRIIDRLSVDDNDAVFWDCDLQGFGVRVYPSGAKAYVVQSRAFGRSKRITVGRHGELSTDQARKEPFRLGSSPALMPAITAAALRRACSADNSPCRPMVCGGTAATWGDVGAGEGCCRCRRVPCQDRAVVTGVGEGGSERGTVRADLGDGGPKGGVTESAEKGGVSMRRAVTAVFVAAAFGLVVWVGMAAGHAHIDNRY